MNKNQYPSVKSDNPMDFIKCALAIEILAYHNRNFLFYNDDKKISEQVQILLEQALKGEIHNGNG